MHRYRLLAFFFVALLSLFIFSCSLKNPRLIGNTSLTIKLNKKSKLSSFEKYFLGPESLLPDDINDFSCYAINVTGPGVPSESPGGECTSNDNMHGHGWGAVSDLAGDGETIQVDVPAGFNRNVSVYGIYPSEHISECGGSSSGGGDNGQGFFLGEEADDILESMSMSIDIDYNPGTPPNITCTGGEALSVSSVFPYGGIEGTTININSNGGTFILGTEVDLVDQTTGAIKAHCVNPACDVGSNNAACSLPPTKPNGNHTLTCVVYDPDGYLVDGTRYDIRLYHPTNGSVYTTDSTSVDYYGFTYEDTAAFLSFDTDQNNRVWGNISTSTIVDKTFSLCNTGNSNHTFASIALSGNNCPGTADLFRFADNACSKNTVSPSSGSCNTGSPITPNSCCTIIIRLENTSPGGPYSATLIPQAGMPTVTFSGSIQ